MTRRALDALLAASAYFTILPVRTSGAAGPPSADALAMLPLLGALIGGAAGGVGYAVGSFVSHPLGVALAFAISMFLTGAIHVDGFLDSCDGLFASVAPERRLEIMDDPRHGTFAVVGFVVAVALWLAALWSLPLARLPALLALSGASSRWAAVMNAFFLPYARPGALSAAFASKPPVLLLALEGAASAVAAWLFVGCIAGPLLVAFVLGASLLGARFARRRLGGGLTGDVYGFLIVCLEILVLFLVCLVH